MAEMNTDQHYQILVRSGGVQKYVYLGTTTTQLHYDPPVGVTASDPESNRSSKQALCFWNEKYSASHPIVPV